MSAGTRFVRALGAMADAAGCPVRIASAAERPWASATFIGARHVIALQADETPTLAAWLDTLAEAEFTVPGHVVVDVAVERRGDAVQVAALTLAEA